MRYLLAAALAFAPAAAGAITLTFDEMEAPALFSDARPVRGQYAPLGVLFSGTGAVLSSVADFGVTGFSPPNMLAYGNSSTFRRTGESMTSDVIRFSAPQDSISFDVGSGFSPLVLELTGYGADGGIVASQMMTLGAALQSVTLGGGITRLELFLQDARELDAFVLDNFTFAEGPSLVQTPAPAAFALFGLGVLAMLRRRTSI